jgi:hypothetical protein
MKKKLSTSVIFLAGCLCMTIILLNLSPNNKISHYFFLRKFNKKGTLFFDKVNMYNWDVNTNMPITTNDSFIYLMQRNSGDSINAPFTITTYNNSFTKKNKADLRIPQSSNILFVNKRLTVFTNFFKLFVYDNATAKIKEIPIPDFKVLKIYPLGDSLNLFVCLAEENEKNIFNTGFFIIDIKRAVIIKDLAMVSKSKVSEAAQNSLSFSGKFTHDLENKTIFYYCDKYSWVYTMDINGSHFNVFQTNDKTPLPQIISDLKGNYFYRRNATWGANYGLLADNKQIVIFSARSAEKDSLLCDVYSRSDFKYKYSFTTFYQYQKAANINNVYFYDSHVTLAFDKSFASFIYSR